jgi:hypothetical protein
VIEKFPIILCCAATQSGIFTIADMSGSLTKLSGIFQSGEQFDMSIYPINKCCKISDLTDM